MGDLFIMIMLQQPDGLDHISFEMGKSLNHDLHKLFHPCCKCTDEISLGLHSSMT